MDLFEKIKKAGIVGCGGAGFPTHIKYNCKIDHLIINGAECEPLLRTDRYIMLNHAEKIITAADAAGAFLGAKEITIALKHNYTEEINALRHAIQQNNSTVKLFEIGSFYPAGDEQVIVYEVTGKVVPPAGIPLTVGCVISNVATMLAISDSIEDVPFTDKYLTVTGEVAKPSVIHTPVGTSLEECIQMAGGAVTDDFCAVLGGPMMGHIINRDEIRNAVVTKTTSGIIILSVNHTLMEKQKISMSHILNRAKSSCVQCSYCTQMCPRHLLGHPLEPHKIMRHLAMNEALTEEIILKELQNALICSECGVCEVYACPMGLQPRRVNRYVKEALRKKGIGFTKKDEICQASNERSYRKIPSKRLASRLGVLPWYELDLKGLVHGTPQKVNIPLTGNVGIPATAVVAKGDTVKKGQCIGKVEPGKLGTYVHASIDGIVVSVTDEITIERRNPVQ